MRHFRRFCAAIAGLVAIGLAGCSVLVDADALHLCRLTLPALHPDAERIEVLRGDAGPPPYTVSLRYRLTEKGQASDHAVACGFGPDPLAPSRMTLERFATEEGAYSPMKVHILNRYWLERPDLSANADPGPPPASPMLALPQEGAYLVQALANALPSTAMMMMIGVAYSLIYGLVGRINLAFGELAMVGAFGTVIGAALTAGLGLGGTAGGLAVAGALGLMLTALWGYAIERTVIAPLVPKSGQAMLVATLALAIVMQELFRLGQGTELRWMPPVLSQPLALAGGGGFIASVTVMQLLVAVLAGGAALFLAGVMRWSEFGRQWRAVADDPMMARLLGIAPESVLTEAFLFASLLAAVAGFVMASYYGGAGFAGGAMIGLKALVAAVVGGIGSVGGALLGGLVVGLFEAAWSAYLPIEQRDLAVLLMLVAVFVLKPGGLMGVEPQGPRPV